MAYTELTTAMIDLNSPIDSQLMTYIRDDLNYLKNAVDGIELSMSGSIPNQNNNGIPNFITLSLEDKAFFPCFGGNSNYSLRIGGVPQLVSGKGSKFSISNYVYPSAQNYYIGYRYMPNPSISVNSNPNFDRILNADIDQDSPLNTSLFTQIKKCFDRLKKDLDGSEGSAVDSGANNTITMNDRSFMPTLGGNYPEASPDRLVTTLQGAETVSSGYTPPKFKYSTSNTWTSSYVGWKYLNTPDGTTDIWSALWTSISDAMIGIEGGLNTTLFTAIRDNIEYLKRRHRSSGDYTGSESGNLTAGSTILINMNDRCFMPRIGSSDWLEVRNDSVTTGTNGRIRLKNVKVIETYAYYVGWRYLSAS